MQFIVLFVVFVFLAIIVFLFISRSRTLARLNETARKLREKEEEYQGILNSLQDVYYKTDMNGIIIEISPSIEHYIGLVPQQIIGKNASEFYINPLDRLTLLEKISKTGSVADYRITLKGENGKPIPTTLAAHLIFNENKKPIAVEGILHELSS